MRENEMSNFQNAILVLIALCAVAITTLMGYQTRQGNRQMMQLEAELDSCKSMIELQESEFREVIKLQESALSEAKVQLKQYEEELSQYKGSLSSTKAYTAWVVAQFVIEPHDLYEKMQYAYEQLLELDSEYLIGTEKYKTALNLLVPKNAQEDKSAYMRTLKRYFDTPDIQTATDRFLGDLVSAELLTDQGKNYYTWSSATLTTKNVMRKLNLTEDVAESLMGLLRAMDWEV